MNQEDKNRIIYRKLIRDRIPEIIRAQGIKPYYRMIEGDELNKSIELKKEETETN